MLLIEHRDTEVQGYFYTLYFISVSLYLCVDQLIEESRLFVLYALLAVNGGKDALHLS